MVPAGTLLTLDQFFELPDYDEKTGCSYELDHGELIVVPPQPRIHELLKNRIANRLTAYLRESGLAGEAIVETGFTLDEDSWRRPDVSYLAGERAKVTRENQWEPFESPPDLAIEVASDSDTRPVLKRKVDHFLASGSRSVWVVYPRKFEAEIYRVGKPVERFGLDDVFEDAIVLPGFRVPVRDLLEA